MTILGESYFCAYWPSAIFLPHPEMGSVAHQIQIDPRPQTYFGFLCLAWGQFWAEFLDFFAAAEAAAVAPSCHSPHGGMTGA